MVTNSDNITLSNPVSWMKEKYTHASNGRFRSHHDDDTRHRKHKRKKIGYDKHVKLYGKPRVKVLVIGVTGKQVFVYQEELDEILARQAR